LDSSSCAACSSVLPSVGSAGASAVLAFESAGDSTASAFGSTASDSVALTALAFGSATDGSIHPKDALKEAAKILIYHFMLFSEEKITLDVSESDTGEEFDEEVLRMRQLLKTKLVDLDLSVRALNCLKAANVETLGHLVTFNKTDLLKFRNFGKKSLTELEDLLSKMDLSFAMDISKYKLEKE
jgi:DNA-directed RNA polymerase subunit alpha